MRGVGKYIIGKSLKIKVVSCYIGTKTFWKSLSISLGVANLGVEILRVSKGNCIYYGTNRVRYLIPQQSI